MYFGKPTSAFAYYRGSPQYGGEGSGQGQPVSGLNVFSAGQGTQSGSSSGWSPTILYLFVLILVEMFIFAWLARTI